MKKDDTLNLRIAKDLKVDLLRAAQDEERSASSMVARIVAAWLEAHGYRKPAPKHTAPRHKGRG